MLSMPCFVCVSTFVLFASPHLFCLRVSMCFVCESASVLFASQHLFCLRVSICFVSESAFVLFVYHLFCLRVSICFVGEFIICFVGLVLIIFFLSFFVFFVFFLSFLESLPLHGGNIISLSHRGNPPSLRCRQSEAKIVRHLKATAASGYLTSSRICLRSWNGFLAFTFCTCYAERPLPSAV